MNKSAREAVRADPFPCEEAGHALNCEEGNEVYILSSWLVRSEWTLESSGQNSEFRLWSWTGGMKSQAVEGTAPSVCGIEHQV